MILYGFVDLLESLPAFPSCVGNFSGSAPAQLMRAFVSVCCLFSARRARERN